MTTMLTIHGIRYRAEDAEAQGLMPAYHAQQEAARLQAQQEAARLQATHHDPAGGDTGAGGEGADGSAVDTSTAEGKARTTRNKARGTAATKAEGQ